jgi:hypothetical protein
MRNIFIDPPYQVLEKNKLFALDDPVLNRDDQLLYFFRLKESIIKRKNIVNTADYLENLRGDGSFEYYSFGNYSRFLSMSSGTDLRAFILMEPPSAFPYIYKALPAISNRFQYIYVHNTEGDGFSIKHVDKSKLRKFYHPIPYRGVLESLWAEERIRKILLINGNHRPLNSNRELYSLRIKYIAGLQKINLIDLYGRGWDRWWSGNSRWLPYWLNRKAILSAWKGSCNSKFELMGCYEFALCIENTEMLGYISEKIFDCFYSGVIPIYFGAPDIDKYIPNNCYIDLRNFSNYVELIDRLNSLTKPDLERYRLNIKNFMSSKNLDPFYNSLENIFDIGT